MQAVEKAISKLPRTTQSPESKEIENIVQKFTKAVVFLDPVLKDRSTWMAANFEKRTSLSSVQVHGIKILLCNIFFSNRLGMITNIQQKKIASEVWRPPRRRRWPISKPCCAPFSPTV